MAEQEVRRYSGRITAANENGFQIDSLPDKWINFGKYYKGTKPNKGDEVAVEATPFGDRGALYVKTIANMSDPGPSHNGNGSNGNGQLPVYQYNGNPQKDRAIARAVALKAAVDFVVGITPSGLPLDKIPEEAFVLRSAEIFEEWLNREPAVEKEDLLDAIPF